MSQQADSEATMLQGIIGEQLSSVEFVMDYVQLRFNGPTLNAVTHPTVTADGRLYSWGESGFRDALCERIARTVISTEVKPGDFLRIDFDDGASIRISLQDQDYETAEAVVFFDGPKTWVL